MIRSIHTASPRAGAVDVVIIGAGHAGLAASYCLSQQGVEHVVLERGAIANSWRNERWDSLKLLTPNWQCRLPGFAYQGDSPDSYMDMPQLIRFLESYATFSSAPVREHTTVERVSRQAGRYRVETNCGNWHCQAVILASGACNVANVPKLANELPVSLTQLTAHSYRNPGEVPEGGVLVVGASASGLQFADELLRAGREVTIASGEHVRMPRHYRGHDMLYWMHRCGILDECYRDMDDLQRARRLPSAQLIGCREREILDLNELTARGARLVGRLMGVNGDQAQFSGSLRNVCALADLKMHRLLNTIDAWIDEHGTQATSARRFEATRVDDEPKLMMNLQQQGINTVIWATGFRPDYSWLDVDALDNKGRLRHDGGIVDVPGLYALGLPMMRRRKSSFIFGIEDDARAITAHLGRWLSHQPEIADYQRRMPALASSPAG